MAFFCCFTNFLQVSARCSVTAAAVVALFSLVNFAAVSISLTIAWIWSLLLLLLSFLPGFARRSSTFLLLLFDCSFYYIKLNLFFVVISLSVDFITYFDMFVFMIVSLYYLAHACFLSLSLSLTLSLRFFYTFSLCFFFIWAVCRAVVDFCVCGGFLRSFEHSSCTVLFHATHRHNGVSCRQRLAVYSVMYFAPYIVFNKYYLLNCFRWLSTMLMLLLSLLLSCAFAAIVDKFYHYYYVYNIINMTLYKFDEC